MKFTFSFTPQKLVNTKKEIERNIEKKYSEQRRFKNDDLLEILKNEIQELNFEDLNYYANLLSLKKLYTLTYNYNKLSAALKNKINIILNERLNKKILKIMWSNFQEDFESRLLNSFFSKVKTQIDKLGLEEKPYSILEEVFSSEKPVKYMAKNIIAEKLNFTEAINKFALNTKKELTKQLILEIFKIPGSKYILEDEENFLEVVASLTADKIKGIAENYLLNNEIKEFIDYLLYLFKDKLGDPREDYSTAWDDINERARNKAGTWFNRAAIREFFDNIKVDQEEAIERFEYWSKYVDQIENVKFIEDKLQLFLYFGSFVVIEFGHKGNAAYIYDKEYFKENFAKYARESNSVKNNWLKHTQIARSSKFKEADKFNHTRGWQYKADNKIKPLLDRE